MAPTGAPYSVSLHSWGQPTEMALPCLFSRLQMVSADMVEQLVMGGDANGDGRDPLRGEVETWS